MGLRDDLPPANKPGTICYVGQLLASLSPTDASDLREMLADPKIQNTQLAGLSDKKEWDISQHSWARHRRGHCKCL